MYLLSLAFKSLRNRKFTSLLTILSIALSIALFIGVEQVRNGVRESFHNTISQTDLIVGSRGGPIQLLLYAVFHIGNATNNIRYESYQALANHPAVKWTIPYSLGDSHKGHRVIATNETFYKEYRFRQNKQLSFQLGREPYDVFEAVLGSGVARKLGYQVGENIVLSHGVTEGEGFLNHEDKPFKVVGVLNKTFTPIDRSIYISLEGMEAIHIDWQQGGPPAPEDAIPAHKIYKEDIEISQITAFLLRTHTRIQTLHLQREINTFEEEPLMAIVPGFTLQQLWSGVSYAEDGLRVVTLFVLLVGFLAMLISLSSSLNERRREMSIFRAVGASPFHIISLLVLESFLLTIAGICFGLVLVYGLVFISQPFIEQYFGLYVPIQELSLFEAVYLGVVLCGGLLIGFIPALKAYRNTLSDGMSIRI